MIICVAFDGCFLCLDVVQFLSVHSPRAESRLDVIFRIFTARAESRQDAECCLIFVCTSGCYLSTLIHFSH